MLCLVIGIKVILSSDKIVDSNTRHNKTMTSIVALGAVTVGINLTVSHAELRELDLTPGCYTVLSVDRMEELRLALENSRGTLPDPRGGGSVANTAVLLARAGVSCGLMGVGGDDTFGRAFVSDCKRVSLEFLSELEDGAVTGYDFYLFDDDGVRTIVWTSGDEVRIELAKTPIDAVVTMDADGAFARFSDEEFLMPTKEIEAVDSTGAGDAFLASFLVARKKGLSVRKALAVGNVVSGEVIQYEGARLPISLDVPGLMQKAIRIAEITNGNLSKANPFEKNEHA